MLKELAQKAQDQLTIGYVSLDDLQDAFLEGNSKRHDINKIIDSIQRYGFQDPIGFDPALNGGEGGLQEGNGRLEALCAMREQGLNPPRGITEDWHIPVLFGVNFKSEAEAKAYSVEHNWSALWGTEIEWEQALSMFDEDALAKQIEELQEEESLPLSIGGEDLGDILEHLGVDELEEKTDYEASEIVEDEVPEDAPTLVERGQIWKLGRHRLYCGDSTDGEKIKGFLRDLEIDLFVTDPPYGVSYADKNKRLNSVTFGNRIQTPIENDHLSVDSISDDLWLPMFKAIFEVAKKGCPYYVFSPQGGELMMMMAINQAGWLLKHCLVWVKNNHVLGGADYHYKHEPCLYGWKPGAGHYFTESRSETSVLEFNKPLKNDLHPTMKPVELIAYLIGNSSKPSELVFDAFLGSGTTLIAAEQTNRTCYGVELSERYCDVILERYKNLTGDNPELEGTID